MSAPAPIMPLFLGAIWGTADRIHHLVGVRAGTEVGALDLVTERARRTLRGVCHIVEHEDNEMMPPLRDRPDPITDP